MIEEIILEKLTCEEQTEIHGGLYCTQECDDYCGGAGNNDTYLANKTA